MALPGRPRASAMLTIEHHASPPPDFLCNEVEGYAFYKAFQNSGIENFEIGYLVATRDQKRVAVVPFFVTRYYVNTTLENGWLKHLLGWLWVRIACVGHPCADFGMIDGEVSAELLQAVNAELFKLAPIVAYKDFGDRLPLRGFSREPNLPVAALEIKGDYYSALSRTKRRDFRRRLRNARSLRIVETDRYPAEHAQRIYELYLQTFNHAEMTFEKLTPRFFENVAPIGKYISLLGERYAHRFFSAALQRDGHAGEIFGYGLREIAPIRALFRNDPEPYRDLPARWVYALSNGRQRLWIQKAYRQHPDPDLHLFQTPQSGCEPAVFTADENGRVRLARVPREWRGPGLRQSSSGWKRLGHAGYIIILSARQTSCRCTG